MEDTTDTKTTTHQSDDALAFRATIKSIMKNISESVSEEEFAQCLTYLNSKPLTVRKLHKAMAKDLYESMDYDLEEILAEANLAEGLGKVKELVAETLQSPDKIAWRPPGNVIEHLRTPDAMKIKAEQERLEKILSNLEAENTLLLERVEEKRSLAHKVEDRVTRALKSGSLSLSHMEKTSESMQNYLQMLGN
ncbi:uncharacterized protein LOC103568175 [Microplitis demolitor]|uniref:uncharacterized protein LOC103568175 n=1 Tax=Microplitis demolitor TaxID=69319 RepID=UPI0004CD3FD1|nr:uncharacterized protein LOC103568175 [Microplitis demolitor]